MMKALIALLVCAAVVAATTPKQIFFYQTTNCVAATVVVSNGVAYTGTDGGRFIAVNANTGALVWAFSIGGGFLQNSPLLVGGIVYFGGDNGILYAVNTTTGSQIWSLNMGFEFNGVAPVAGSVKGVSAVFIGSGGNVFNAVNAATGAVIWSYSSASSVYSTAAWDGTNLIIGNYGNQVISINSQTGASNWVTTITQGAEVFNPTVSNGVIYIGTQSSGTMNAISTNGTLLWTVSSYGVVGFPAVSQSKQLVFWPVNNGSVVATDFSGNTKWVYTVGGTQLNSNIIRQGATIYVGGYNGLIALDEAGNQQWNITVPGYASQLGSPTIQDGKAYFGTCLSSPSGVYGFSFGETINEQLCGDSSCASTCETVAISLGCIGQGAGSVLRYVDLSGVLVIQQFALSATCDQSTPYTSSEYAQNKCYSIPTGGSFSWSK